MKAFRIQSDNLYKMICLPYYGLMFILARLMPRDPKIWIFGRKIGLGEGPLAVYYEVKKQLPNVRCVWLSQNHDDISAAKIKGILTVKKNSIMGLWLSLRAKVAIVTHGLGDVNRAGIGGAFIVNLWHGTPLKKIHLDHHGESYLGNNIIARKIAKQLTKAFKQSLQTYRLIAAPSEEVRRRYISAFGVAPEVVKVLGDPRCDILFGYNSFELRQKLLHCLNLDASRLILYAPTWRDGAKDPAIPKGATLKKLQDMLAKHDAAFIVRSHPYGFGLEKSGLVASRVKLLAFEDFPVINDWLPAIDYLITDYSGIAMDFALLKRPIIFFAPDLIQYKNSRGFYEPYEEFTSGFWYGRWEEVIDVLSELCSEQISNAITEKVVFPILAKYQFYMDGKSAQRIVDEIRLKIGLINDK